MKILTISNLYPPHHVGGYEVRCQQVMDRLRDRGHEVSILTSTHVRQDADAIEEPHVERSLRVHGFFGHPWLPMRRLLDLERHNHRVLQAALERVRPDVVHVWNMGGISKSLLHRLEAQAVPVVYDVSDHWIARSLRGDVWLGWWNRPATGANLFLRGLAKLVGLRARLDRETPTHSWDALRWKRIYFCSAFLRQLTVDAEFAVNHGDVIYCGVETNAFVQKEDFGTLKRLLFVGRLSEDKDPLTAIRAVAKARASGDVAVTLDLYGHGEEAYVQSLRDEVVALGLGDAVRFCSATPDEMRDVYARYDALLFTSNWGEPFALTPLEAMAAHLPVILCPDGGDAELGRDRENCILAEAANPDSVAAGILALAHDPGLQRTIAATAGREVRERYDLDAISGQIEAYLEASIVE